MKWNMKSLQVESTVSCRGSHGWGNVLPGQDMSRCSRLSSHTGCHIPGTRTRWQTHAPPWERSRWRCLYYRSEGRATLKYWFRGCWKDFDGCCVNMSTSCTQEPFDFKQTSDTVSVKLTCWFTRARLCGLLDCRSALWQRGNRRPGTVWSS